MASRHGERVLNVNLMRDIGRAGKERRARGRAPECRNECLIDRGAPASGVEVTNASGAGVGKELWSRQGSRRVEGCN